MNYVARPAQPLANVRAEEAVIGKIICDPHAYWSIADDPRAEHFSQQHHRDIFNAVAKACDEASGPSLSRLESMLPIEWDGVGYREAVLLIMMEKASDVVSPSDFVHEIVDAWEARQSENGLPKGTRSIRLVPFERITLSPRRRDLIRGLMPREGLSIIWGPPKCGKSFWFFDCLMRVALGWWYRGRRIHQGKLFVDPDVDEL